MCRSIKVLRQGSVPATEGEIEAAALQFVRKVPIAATRWVSLL